MDVELIAWSRAAFANGAAKALRVAARLSLREVAAAAGVSAPALSRYERGLRRPRAAEAERLGRILRELARGSGK